LFRPDQFDIFVLFYFFFICMNCLSFMPLSTIFQLYMYCGNQFHATFNNILVIHVLWKSISCHFQQYFSYTCIVEISFMPLSTIFQLYMYCGNQFHATFINISTIHVFQFYGNQFHATCNNNYCKNINMFIIEQQSTNYQNMF
jgi:hypothetical protein